VPLTIKLKDRKEVAAGTMAFHFGKPSGFTFAPGQAGDFILADPPETDAEGNKRSFSLASAPYEDDLIIATRMRDTAFKRSLKTIPLGTEFILDAPWGELTLHEDTSVPAVFLTGGIGITPVRSIVLQATRDKLAQKLVLFYSNHRPEDTAFLDELTAAQKANPNFILVATMTKMEKSSRPWHDGRFHGFHRDGVGNRARDPIFRERIQRLHVEPRIFGFRAIEHVDPERQVIAGEPP